MVVLCMGIAAAVFFGDLWIKNRIEKNLPEGEERKILRGKLLLRKHHNKGLPLNFASGRQSLVTALSVVMVVMTLVLFLVGLGKRGNHLLLVGLSLLLGGGFSNTYDRLKRKYVVDYVSFNVPWKKFRRIIFNCSDFCIIIGALLAVLGAKKAGL